MPTTANRLTQGGLRKRFTPRQRALLVMLAPAIVWFVIFRYLPMAGIAYAFTDFGYRLKVSFIGFENFARLFKSRDFNRVSRLR